MPTKRLGSSMLSRKYSNNNIQVSELNNNNNILQMFKKIESDSNLLECDLCQKKLKPSVLDRHKQFQCSNNIKKELNQNQEIIIIDDDQSLKKEVELDSFNQEDTYNSFSKRIKTENSFILSKEDFGDNQTDNSTTEQEKSEQFDFYLSNFTNALESVLNEEQFYQLFNENDLKTIEKFNSFNKYTKMLYVRLFQRKFKWHSIENIKYERISTDLNPFLDELKKNEFLIDETSITTYEEIIYLFKIPQLKELIRICHMSVAQSNKTEMIRSILQHFKTQKSVRSHFFKNRLDGPPQSDSTSNYMVQCKKILGKSFKLEKNVRSIFVRVLILYSLSSSYQSDPNNAGQQQLYEKALDDEFELFNVLDGKDYEQAYCLFKDKIEKYKSSILDSSSLNRDKALPVYLLSFTSGSIYTKILSIFAFEVLQRLKKYQEANDLFEFLLYKQNVYRLGSRSKWFERLAINYETHLKNPLKSFQSIKNGLEDQENIIFSGRLNLFSRLEKISNTKRYLKIEEINQEIGQLCAREKYDFKEAPIVEILGTLLHTSEFIPGRKNVFIDSPSKSGMTISVEQVALSHYIDNLGYTHGKHAETSTLTTLYGILFWDIIWENSVFNVFVDKFQHGPLDLQTKDFYKSRQDIIEKRLNLFKSSSIEDICKMASDSWNSNFGYQCLGVNFELFESKDEFLSLLKCFKVDQLANLCEYFSKNYRYCRSGGPDLVVWSNQTDKVKFVEVKGPGDHLSYKQMIWLDFMIKNLIDCEVCHVKGLNSKRLR